MLKSFKIWFEEKRAKTLGEFLLNFLGLKQSGLSVQIKNIKDLKQKLTGIQQNLIKDWGVPPDAIDDISYFIDNFQEKTIGDLAEMLSKHQSPIDMQTRNLMAISNTTNKFR